MARVVLERSFDPANGKEQYQRASEELERCLETRDVRPIRSFVAADYTRALCEFDAPDADALRAALRQAGIPFERVWVGTVIDW